MSEPVVLKQKCFFCAQDEIVEFDEHYYWCPRCRAVYTYMLILERGCDHIPGHEPDNCPVVEEQPNRRSLTKGKTFIKQFGDRQWCSQCGAACVADGW